MFKSLPRLLLFLATMVLLLPALADSWANNAWSLQHLKQVTPLPSPPNNHPRALLWLARDAIQAGDPEQAQMMLSPFVALGDPDALSITASALASQGDFPAAIQLWAQAGDVISLKAAALDRTAATDFESALLAYQAIYAVTPEEGALQLADFLRQYYDDNETSETILRQALADYPNSRYQRSWLRRLSSILQRLHRWDEAEMLYQQLLAETPAAWIYIEWGWMYYWRGDGVEAAQMKIQQAIDLSPEDGTGYFSMARMLVLEEQYAQAEQWFVEALARNPDNGNWQIQRANAVRDAGNVALAIALYQDILTNFPGLADGYYEVAWAYYLNGDYTQAAAAIDETLILDSSPDIPVYLRAGAIYESVGDTQKALDAYQKVLILDPDNQAALQRIAGLSG